MAHDDGLFQLGMDLPSGSSTAQTEDQDLGANGAPGEVKDYFCERDGVRFAGCHLLIDIHGARHLSDIAHMEAVFRRCIDVAGATLLHMHFHHFTPNGGVSGVAVLAESHMSIHTWPEHGFAALDIFMCGATRPQAAIEELRAAFQPRRMTVTEHLRGRKTPGGA